MADIATPVVTPTAAPTAPTAVVAAPNGIPPPGAPAAEVAPVAATPGPRTETAAERFARLARAETDYRNRDAQVKSREQEANRQLHAAREEAKAAAEFRKTMALAKTDPVAYLRAAGVDPASVYRQMTDAFVEGKDFVVNQDTPEAQIAVLNQKIADLENGVNSRISEAIGSVTQQRQQEEIQARKAYESELLGHISDNRVAYPLIAGFDLAWKVDEVIQQHEKETGRILRVDTACKMVEDAYRKSNIVTPQAIATPAAPTLATPVAVPNAGPQVARNPAPGLSQNMGSVVPPSGSSGPKVSDVERAIAKYAQVHAENVAAGRYK